MAERYGSELAEALPEVDLVAGFGVPLVDRLEPAPSGHIGCRPSGRSPACLDLLNLPRPAATAPWAYVKVAEGCDRACGFCAIPSFRGKQRSRDMASILAEIDQLGAREIVLVAQDLASYGRDQGVGERAIVPLVRAATERVARVRLLYLYPSDLTDPLIDAVCDSGVPYFDLSLQHVSRPLAASDAAVGRRRSVPASHRRHPAAGTGRGVPIQLHRRVSGRDRGRPRRAARASSKRRSSTGAASSPTRRRPAPTPPAWTVSWTAR